VSPRSVATRAFKRSREKLGNANTSCFFSAARHRRQLAHVERSASTPIAIGQCRIHWPTSKSLANVEIIGQRRNHWPTSKSLANVEIIGQRRNHWPTSKSLANVEIIGQRRIHWPTSKSLANVEIIGQRRNHWPMPGDKLAGQISRKIAAPTAETARAGNSQ